MAGPPVHPAAELFPRLSDADLAALADDIRLNGLQSPIVLLDGKVLDGRNRLAACERAGVEPTFKTLARCESPATYVLSANLHRRHLEKSQRAAVAAEVMPMFEEEARGRQRAGGARGTEGGRGKKKQTLSSDLNQGFVIPGSGKSATQAAKALGVSTTLVYAASRVLKEGTPELVAAVKSGKISVTAAEEAVKRPATEQRKLAKTGRSSKPAPLRWSPPVTPKTYDPAQSAATCAHCKAHHQDWRYIAEPMFDGTKVHKWACERCDRITHDDRMTTEEQETEITAEEMNMTDKEKIEMLYRSLANLTADLKSEDQLTPARRKLIQEAKRSLRVVHPERVAA